MSKGNYIFELWGCSSGFLYINNNNPSGVSYVRGYIPPLEKTKFYLHVCSQGYDRMTEYAYGGGGETDIKFLIIEKSNYRCCWGWGFKH